MCVCVLISEKGRKLIEFDVVVVAAEKLRHSNGKVAGEAVFYERRSSGRPVGAPQREPADGLESQRVDGTTANLVLIIINLAAYLLSALGACQPARRARRPSPFASTYSIRRRRAAPVATIMTTIIMMSHLIDLRRRRRPRVRNNKGRPIGQVKGARPAPAEGGQSAAAIHVGPAVVRRSGRCR
jgi:hypothetical protein